MTSNKQRGFSLLELLMTVSIGFTLAAITFMALMPLFNKSHVDSAYETTLMALRNTRNLAVAQSHQYIVTFVPCTPCTPNNPATIQVTYQPPAGTNGAAAGVLPAVQNVASYSLPSDINYAVMAGFPAKAPDNFGTGVVAIDFGQQLGGGSLSYVTFMPDGSSQDTLGNYNNGVIYLARPSDTIYSSRAISVWGATGRVRGWRLYKQAGSAIWVQQ